MDDVRPMSGLIQGLVGGVTTLAVLAVRAALEGRPGVTFADLWTALAVGIAVWIVPVVLAGLMTWRLRRGRGGSFTSRLRPIPIEGCVALSATIVGRLWTSPPKSTRE